MLILQFDEMATAFSPGGQSPTSFSRTLEKVFDEAQYTGVINLSGRKLKEYPKISSKYDLIDTTVTGRLKKIPHPALPESCVESLTSA